MYPHYSDCSVNTISSYNDKLNSLWRSYVKDDKKFDIENELGFDWNSRRNINLKDHSDDCILAFKARYKGDWKKKLHSQKLLSKIRCIKDLVDPKFMVAGKLYNDGQNYWVYHDALS